MKPNEYGIDCHIHLFGDIARYPAIAGRTYTPSPATFPEWRGISGPLCVDRAVLVQPSAYGTDNTRMLEGLREAGDQARGVAVIDETFSDEALSTMHSLGVRGVRLNLVTGVSPDQSQVETALRWAAARVSHLGWHIQVLAHGALLDIVSNLIPTLSVPVVFDHMAGARASFEATNPSWRKVVELFRDGGCWIKISGADHVSRRRDAPEEALPIMRSLIDANPAQLVWGSDWPHIGKAGGPETVNYLPIDHGRLLTLLRDAAGTAFDRIMVDNPERLYGWR